MENVMLTPYVDPRKFGIRNRDDVSSAITQLHAQINKWCDDQGYLGLTAHSILVNKLMYYTEKEVQKKNEKFKIDTGWYLYGPCYENGRTYELEESPISIVRESEEVSDEVSAVCQELVPLYYKYYKKGHMSVKRDFLRDIYTKKCDHKELSEYYPAKHDLQCQLWDFDYGNPEFDGTEYDRISRVITQFDRVLIRGKYPEFVGLKNEEIYELLEFTPVFEEYVRLAAEGSGSRPLFEALKSTADVVLKALAHLNYARTFEAASVTHTKNVRSTHKQTACKNLKLLPEENHRLLDAYRPTT